MPWLWAIGKVEVHEMKKNCARCGAPFLDAQGFITCPGCRIPDTKVRPMVRYSWTRGRDASIFNDESGAGGVDNNVRASEEDR